MKTEKLFNYYTSILNEEVDGGAPDATDVAEVPAEAMAAETDELTSEGEKVLVELLVKAFLHEPNDSDQAVAKELQLRVDEDPKGVAADIGNLVEMGEGDMKETLAL
jgi:hypothetical protein